MKFIASNGALDRYSKWEFEWDEKDKKWVLITELGNNGLYEISCEWVVLNTLRTLKIPMPDIAVSPLGIHVSFDDSPDWCKIADKNTRDFKELGDEKGSVGPGDILVLDPKKASTQGLDPRDIPPEQFRGYGHVAIISQDPIKKNGVWELQHYTSQNPDVDISDLVFRVGQDKVVELGGVYRPTTKKTKIKSKGRHPIAPLPPVGLVMCDPLLMDTNGDGIATLGTDAGIYFDHDGDGFKELTGWVDTGDGVLMLDINGNGRLDDGSELFGGDMVLANGETGLQWIRGISPVRCQPGWNNRCKRSALVTTEGLATRDVHSLHR